MELYKLRKIVDGTKLCQYYMKTKGMTFEEARKVVDEKYPELVEYRKELEEERKGTWVPGTEEKNN